MAIDSTASVIDRGSFSVTSLSPSSPHPLSLAPSLPSTRSFPLPPSAPPLLLTLPPLPDHLQACSPGIESHKYPANAESLGRVGQPPIHQNSDLVDPPLQAEGGGGGGAGEMWRGQNIPVPTTPYSAKRRPQIPPSSLGSCLETDSKSAIPRDITTTSEAAKKLLTRIGPPAHLIMSMAGIPYLRYSPHLLRAAAAEKPPHVAVASPAFCRV